MPSRAAAVALAACTLAACSGPSARSAAGQQHDETAQPSGAAAAVVERTNAARAEAGLAELRPDERLMKAARIHAEQLAAAGQLAHTLEDARYPGLEDRLEAVDYPWRAVAENVALGQDDAAAVVDTWMQSPTHRTNILNEAFTEIGAARVVGQGGKPYWVQVFGTPFGSGQGPG